MAAAPTAPANAAFLRSKLSKLASMRTVIASLDNPRSFSARRNMALNCDAGCLSRKLERLAGQVGAERSRRGHRVGRNSIHARGRRKYRRLHCWCGAGSGRQSNARGTLNHRDYLCGSIKVAKGCFAKSDGTVVDAGVNASAVRLKATGEAAVLVQNAAPDNQISVRLPSSGAQILCAPQDLENIVDIAAGDWVSNAPHGSHDSG